VNGWPHQTREQETRRRGSLARLGVIAAVVALSAAVGQCAVAEAQILKAGLEEVRSLEQQGQYDRAIQRNRELLRQFPHSAVIRQGLTQDLAKIGRCEEAASVGSASSAAGQIPGDQETVIGICYFRKNDLSNALMHLKQAVKVAPNNKSAAIFLARVYASAGQVEEGIRTLEAFQTRRGEDPDVLYWTGTFYDQLAEQTYQAMAKSHPGSYLVLETQGDQFLQQQKYDDALNAYVKALSAAPNASGLHFDLGNTYWRMAKLDQARRELEAELQLNPGNAQANYELGDIEVKQGEVERGMPLLKKALALDPTLVGAHRSLGRAFLADRQYAEAVREFFIVAEAEPSDHTIHALIASVYQRMGRTQEAEEENRKYNELVKQHMSDLERKEARQDQDASAATPTPKN
jgi:tetratricopeptide (TPR) repeat protein